MKVRTIRARLLAVVPLGVVAILLTSGAKGWAVVVPTVPAAAATGHMNAAPFIQRSWDAGRAVLPCGTYRLDTPLVAHGDGSIMEAFMPGCVTVTIAFAAGDVIVIPGLKHVQIVGIHFTSAVRRTSGALIHLEHAAFTELQISAEASAVTPFEDGIVIDDHSSITRISSTYLANAIGACIRVDGRSIESYLTEINTAACGVGLDLHEASGVYLDRLDLVGSATSGLVIDPPTGTSVNAVYGSTVLSDSSTMDGISLRGRGDITELNIVNLWASDSGTTKVFEPGQTLNRPAHGILFDNPHIDGVTLTGPRAKGNGGHGILVAAGRDIQLLDPQALMNGASFGTVPPNGQNPSSKRYDGIHLAGAATNIIVSAAICGSGGWEASVGRHNQQGWGLYRDAGPRGQIVAVVNGIFTGNVDGTYRIESSPEDHLTIAGNLP